MAKYHINPSSGDVSACRAKVSCPFGDFDSDHYSSPEAARSAYEERQENPAPKKQYRSYSREESMEIANTIKRQIGPMTLMSLGASHFTAMDGGLRFNARILPFLDSGVRSGRPANMFVEVRLNGLDYYDVKVTRVRGFTADVHYEAENVDATTLSPLLFSLDYNGPTVLNPRI